MYLSPPLWRDINERVNKLIGAYHINMVSLFLVRRDKLNIEEGYFYFIKNEFFEKVKDSELMKNKKNGIKRPCYYCFKNRLDDKTIWFIPLSSKVEKYKKIYNHKIEKQKRQGKKVSIDTIVFGNVANIYSTFLIQNMFPVTEEYIKNQYIKNNVKIKLSNKLKNEIIFKAMKVLNLYDHGMKNIIFPDIDNILRQLKCGEQA